MRFCAHFKKPLLSDLGVVSALVIRVKRFAQSALSVASPHGPSSTAGHQCRARSFSKAMSSATAGTGAKSVIEAQLLTTNWLSIRNSEEFKLQLSLTYPQPSSELCSAIQPHLFNFNRAREETSIVTLSRIQASINTHLQSRLRSKKKKQQQQQQLAEQPPDLELESHPSYISDLVILDSSGSPLDPNAALCGDAFSSGHTLCLNSGAVRYAMLADPGLIVSCKLTSQLLSGFPLHCDLQLESCTDCQRLWEISPTLSKPRWVEFSRSRCPSLPFDSAGCFVRLTAVPIGGGGALQFQQTFGPVADAVNNYVSTRHAFTPAETGPEAVRVVSYNLLANVYADSDYSRDQLFPWCDPSHLSMSYRKCLIFRELSGYRADILALQEVDEPLFRSGGLSEFLEHECGLAGRSQMKLGQDGKPSQEGLAVFYRLSRFEFVEERSLTSLNEYLDSSESLSWLSAAIRGSGKFLEIWQPRGQCAQVLVLRCRQNPDRYLCVCTTHLFWHPPANLVRLLQTYLVLHHLDRLKREYSASGRQLAVVFAGDFNSTPDRGPYWLATRGSLPAEHADWFSPGREAMIARRELHHGLSLAPAYEPQPFTNYTGGFSGHLDHIFYDTELLRLRFAVPLPSLNQLHALSALPNRCYPSDHLALVADLLWR